MTISQPILDDLASLPAEPYPGLRAFEPGEWAIFFGREPMIDEVITRLLDRQIVAVHGSSGCGKSSLIRAGVLPWLQMEHARGSVGWNTASMRPAERPLRNLARALAETLGSPPGAASGQAGDEWHDRLTLGEARRAIERQLAAPQRLCLLIDQFEELFRYAREGGREEAQLFVELLCGCATSPIPGLCVVLTMRSDYIGQCAQFDGFAEAVDRCQYLVPRMDNLALLRAIHEPARLFGGAIDATVADRLLFRARREEDSLPILQHTLMRACRCARERQGQGRNWTVTPEDLQKVEGEYGALSTHAEEILGNLGQDNKGLIGTAEWVFRSLADIDSEGRIVRRPCRVAQLVEIAGGKTKEAEVAKVIEAFRTRECSFLMPPPSEELIPETMVDVGHEALLRQWTRISNPSRDPLTREPAGWLWREIEDGQRWRALAVQAQAFMTDRRATLSPATTAAYQDWWPAHTPVWAARYARQPKDAAREYAEMQELWEASKRGARKDRFWRRVRLSFRATSAGAILVAFVAFVLAILGVGDISGEMLAFVVLFIFAGALVYAIASLIALMGGIPKLWSRLRGYLRRNGRGIASHKGSL